MNCLESQPQRFTPDESPKPYLWKPTEGLSRLKEQQKRPAFPPERPEHRAAIYHIKLLHVDINGRIFKSRTVSLFSVDQKILGNSRELINLNRGFTDLLGPHVGSYSFGISASSVQHTWESEEKRLRKIFTTVKSKALPQRWSLPAQRSGCGLLRILLICSIMFNHAAAWADEHGAQGQLQESGSWCLPALMPIVAASTSPIAGVLMGTLAHAWIVIQSGRPRPDWSNPYTFGTFGLWALSTFTYMTAHCLTCERQHQERYVSRWRHAEAYVLRTVAGVLLSTVTLMIRAHPNLDAQLFLTYIPPSLSLSAFTASFSSLFVGQVMTFKQAFVHDGRLGMKQELGMGDENV